MDRLNIDLQQEELNILCIALELYCINLNSIWCMKKDTEKQEQKYHIVFYLYQRLLSYSTNYEKYLNIDLYKPSKIKNKKLLTFSN